MPALRRGSLVLHQQLELAEMVVLTETHRPRGPERCARLAEAHELRARALRRLTASTAINDRFGHLSRAVELAARADDERAANLRRALAGCVR